MPATAETLSRDDDLHVRVQELERQLACHVNSTNNPHHTTAKLSGAVSSAQYKTHIHQQLTASLATLPAWKGVRNVFAFAGLMLFIAGYYAPEPNMTPLVLCALVVGLVGAMMAGLVVERSSQIRQLRAHLNDISR